MSPAQLSLLEPPAAALPAGFVYRPGLIAPEEERELVAAFGDLDFHPFEFHGYVGKRRVVSFGLHYDFGEGRVRESPGLPQFLLPLRDRAAAFAGVEPAALAHALVLEYEPGAAIGWHRDRPVFGDVIGVSFVSECRFRFRRASVRSNPPPLAGEGWAGAKPGKSWERAEVILQPRSAYLLRGAARNEWEHSIPPGEALRYSVTFRTARVG